MTRHTLGVTPAGEALAIDVDRLVLSRMLLTANSGAGKSWALRRLLEQTHGALQHLVIDPEGEFYTLRERFDYVLAGRGGDCPAEPRSAALLARRLLELGTSAVLDIYELPPGDRRRFVRIFLESLIDAPRELWHPVLVVLDEAHAFAPEKGHGEAESSDAVARLMAQGRKRGFAGVLATQRFSKLSKDVAAEANNVLIGRAALDTDLKRVGDSLGMAKADWPRVRALPPGRFFAFGPALSDQVVEVQVGPIVTSHPRAGQRAARTPPPRERVQKVLAQLADLPKEAAEELATVTALRAKVKELGRELAAAKRAQPPPPKVERVEVQVLDEKLVARVEKAAEKASARGDAWLAAQTEVRELLKRIAVRIPAPMPAKINQPRTPNPGPKIVRKPKATAGISGSEDLSRSQQKILDTLATLASIGIEQPTKNQLALWSDVSPTSGGFFNNLGRLRSLSLIDYPAGGEVALTSEGAALATAEEIRTVEEMHAALFAKLGSSKTAILRELISRYPADVAKDELAEAIGVSPTSGGYFNNLGALRTLGLIDYPKGGRVAALSVLFLDGAQP